jgi:hypothetical protein
MRVDKIRAHQLLLVEPHDDVLPPSLFLKSSPLFYCFLKGQNPLICSAYHSIAASYHQVCYLFLVIPSYPLYLHALSNIIVMHIVVPLIALELNSQPLPHTLQWFPSTPPHLAHALQHSP